ncbi:MAG: SxtJ family membrane protein [Bacteroidota bacterium]
MTEFLRTVRAELAALDVSPRALRQFGLVVGGVLLAIAGLLLWRRGLSAWVWGLGSVGGVLVVLGAVAPVALRSAHRVWMTLAFALGFVMTRVILTLAYVLIFIPTALVLRLIGKDLLSRTMAPPGESYWIRRDDGVADRESLERYF